MPPEKKDLALLLDMLDSARAVIGMTWQMSFSEFCQDRRTRRAVEREIEIIGEAARRVSDPCRNLLPEIQWGR